MKEISKEKLAFSIQALMLFLNSALKNKKLTSPFVKKQRALCTKLLTEVEEKEIEDSILTLNNVILEMNHALKGRAHPYPTLDFFSPYHEVRRNILGFEHYLIQKLEEQRLPLDMQMALFKRATTLWGEIGNRATPQEGAEEFSEIIEHTNALLGEDEHYPKP